MLLIEQNPPAKHEDVPQSVENGFLPTLRTSGKLESRADRLEVYRAKRHLRLSHLSGSRVFGASLWRLELRDHASPWESLPYIFSTADGNSSSRQTSFKLGAINPPGFDRRMPTVLLAKMAIVGCG